MSREDNIIIEAKAVLMPTTNQVFRLGKVIGNYRIFATYLSRLEIHVGNVTNHTLMSAVFTNDELMAATSGIFNNGSRLRTLINQPKDDIVLSVTGNTLLIQIPLLSRSISLTMNSVETTPEQSYKFLQDEYAAYRDQMDRAIDGYKKQLVASSARHSSYDSLLDI
jgi:hypothetical protein